MTDAAGRRPGRLPVWERLAAPPGQRLVVAPCREVALDVAVVRDGTLPAAGDAVLFDAWRAGGRYSLRAARIDAEVATPYLVAAAALRIEPPSDGQLERLLAMDDAVPPPGGELERLACACVGVSTDAAYAALSAGWLTVDALKRATKATFGACQGRRCVPWLAARAELDPRDARATVTPRPPLVPVPASILAAFAPPVETGPERAG